MSSSSSNLQNQLSQSKKFKNAHLNSITQLYQSLEKQTQLLLEKEKELNKKEQELKQRETNLSKSEQEMKVKKIKFEAELEESKKQMLADLEEREKRISEIEEKLSKSTTVTSRLKSKNQVVKLNVGGTIFATTLSSLLNEKDTFFTGYFSNHFAPTPEEDDNAFFIDRPSSQFGLILDHLRGLNIEKKIALLSEKKLMEFVEEVVYYQVTSIYSLLPPKGKRMLKHDFNVVWDNMGPLVDIQFDPNYCSSNLQLSNGNKRVKKVGSVGSNAMVIGTDMVEEYSVKLIANCHNYVLIGFAPRHSNINATSLNYSDTNGYYIATYDGNLYSTSKYDEKYAQEQVKDGSMITCILKDNIISFKVNGKEYGKAYDVPSNVSQQLYPVILLPNAVGCEFEIV
ncbi:hypothetical protein C9374_008189 [Naegleria lovaniensis]|uniref:BTB domain-containing protein n=1 Tax=Naegleria lovaniensis TaxID=51637 RepID=A0AA88KGD7_NAELO|nr:uncharacterized protein C9374_008189 [Naegleria lovaniensis]KAG2378550.1 hypothetical protein C9374_008189 [Naegleria lovaniensis]